MNKAELDFISKEEKSHFYFVQKRKILKYVYNKYKKHSIINPLILDLSCSSATDIRIFDNIIGMDIDYDALLLAQNINKPIINADANILPFKDNSFDILLAVDLISVKSIDEHILISEIERVLKPGGYIYINVPAMQFLYGKHDKSVGNRRRYCRKDIHYLFKENHWNIVMHNYWTSLLFPIVVIQRKVFSVLRGDSYISDLTKIPSFLNRLFIFVYNAEMILFKLGILPIGISLFTVIRKNEKKRIS